MNTTTKNNARWPRIALAAKWNPNGKRNLVIENEVTPPGKTGRTYRPPKLPLRSKQTATR